MTTKVLTPDSRPLTPDPASEWPAPPHADHIVVWQRLMLFFAGAVLVSLLITAACLPPHPQGMGTHQQLGLPPCSFVLWFGSRCPACGMTTSWAHLMRGQVLQSAQTNTGGLILGLFTLGLSPWMIVSAVRGRWWIGVLEPHWILAGGGLVFIVTAAQWLWRILL